MRLSRALAHRDTIARLTDADRTLFFDCTGRILRLLEDDAAAHTHDDDGVTGQGQSYVCFGCGQPSDDHPSDSEEADRVYTFNCTTHAASIAAACAAEALGADFPSAAPVIRDSCLGVPDRWELILTDEVTESGEPAVVPQYYRLPEPGRAPPAPFTLTSADYTKLVEAIPALTGKVDQVVKKNQSLKAQAQAGATRAAPAAPRPPPEAAPSNYTTPAEPLSSTGASTHRCSDKSYRTKFYLGYKDHLGGCDRPLSSPLHYANRAYGLLHVVDSPLFDASPDGERCGETNLSVPGRIRFMHAVHKACEHGDGGSALSWPSIYAYIQRYRHTYLASRELYLFDQYFLRLQAKQMGRYPAPWRRDAAPADGGRR
eukprot:jgi/Tetstr1/432178/TSEL_021634.t1